MKLQDLANGTRTLARPLIGGDVELAVQMQTRLAELGLLDPPADGKFASASQWALTEFLSMIKRPGNSAIDAGIARKLLEADAENFLPVNIKNNFAGRLVRAAREAGYWL